MPANIFDQFDSPASGGKNIFDQFDPQPATKASNERSLAELGTDLGAGALKGALAGDKLTYDEGFNNPAVRFIDEFGKSVDANKSAKLRAAEQRNQEATAKAGQAAKAAVGDGAMGTAARVATEFGVGGWKALSDPTTLPNFVAEQIPMMGAMGVGARLAGAGTKAALNAAPALAATRAGAVAAAGARTAGAVGTSMALQGTDIAGDVFNRLMALPDEVWAENVDFAALAKEIGVGAAKVEIAGREARSAGAKAALASGLTSMLPGGAALEKAIATKGRMPLRAVPHAVLGEARQEGLEEGFGQLYANQAVGSVDTKQDLAAGVGGAAGQGAVLGGLMGGGMTAARSVPVGQIAGSVKTRVHDMRSGGQAQAKDAPLPMTGRADASSGPINADVPPGTDQGGTSRQGALPPDARLVELELLAESRGLAPSERDEVRRIVARLGASEIDADTSASSQSVPAEVMPPVASDSTVPANFWAFARQRGFAPQDLQIGSPKWAALRREYVDARAGGRPAKVRARAERTSGADELSQLTPPGPAPSAAETALLTPRALTSLDRVDAIDRELTTKAADAPEVQALQAERAAITKDWPALVPGAPTTFSTEDGVRIEARYAIMDADALVTSHDESLRANPTYPAEMQPRDRTRLASAAQISGIVQKLDPARLGLSADAATGAPIVGEDGLVESGNARTIAMKRVYQANAQQAEGYKTFLRANAAQFGITPESVDTMAKPVLVRVRSTPVNRAEFARQANAPTVALMSPSEQARSDSKRIDAMDDLNPTEEGDFSSSRDFIRRFVGRLPQTEQGAMQDAGGVLSSAGYARVRNAVLAKAYGDSPVLTRMVESMDDNLRNVSKALMIAAPQVAQARQAIGDGRRFDADITPHLVSAVEELGRLRDAGTSVDDALAQAGLMGETYTPETREMLRFLADNTRRPRRMAQFIGAYFDALDAAGDPAQGSLLGDVQAPTTTDLMAAARRATQGETNAAVATNPERAVDREAAPDRAGAGRRSKNAPRDGGGNEGNGVAAAGPDAADQGAPAQGDVAPDLAAQKAAAVARAQDALGDIASVLSKHTRAAMLPEDHPGLMPALVKLFDAAIDIVGTDLKAATKWVREQLRADPRTKAVWNRVATETYRKAAVQALEQRDGRGDASGLFGADELPLLSTYSDADLKAKTEREDAAAKADVQEQRDLTVKASADAQRSEFTLTGSNRTADVAAAAGQRGIFDQAPPSAAPAGASKAPDATKIDDVGEKVGGARKDMAISGATSSKRATDDERPAWARRFSVGQIVRAGGQINAQRDEGRWVIHDTRSTDWTGQPRQVGRDTFSTKEDADAAVPLAAVSLKHRPVPTRDGKYEIWRDITDRKRVKVVEQAFDTRDEALAYMMANAVAIVETNTTFGEADLPLPPDRARDGPQRRTGNVNGGDFKDAFGLRGVEFGNWNNQDERQALMNDAWDGLMDLADVLGVPAKALGLNGDLALAFGARGHGLNSARAHYELHRAVINLTKERGAGSLAHEWFHALDHYFGRQDGKASATWQVQPDGTRTLKTAGAGADVDMASAGFRGERSGVRPELRTAYERLLTTMTKKAEVYVEDTAKVDQFTGRAKEELAGALDKLRAELSAQKDPAYYKRNNKPASAELLAEFDTIAKAMVGGELLTTDWRTFAAGTEKRPALAARWTNESLETLSAIYKEVRGRSGFDSTSRDGVMDRMRGYMGRYSQRLKMLADAQQGSEKTRMVPTEFAMNAKELDQGRGGDYWTTPHEMAARAFQGYVEDTIAERGGVSRFLNYAPENSAILTPWGAKRPYPAGAERKAINVALDAFVKELKTRTDDDGNVALLSRGSGGGIAYKDLLTVASVIAEKLSGLPKVNVLSSPATAPKSLQDAIRARNAMSDAEGALHQGEIYLFASGIRDAERAEHVLAEHEAAHVGLRGLLGNSLPQQMQAIFNLNASVRRQVAAMLEREPGMSLAHAVEEVLVDMPSSELIKLQGWRALVGKAVQWLAAHGFEITATKLSRWLKGTLSQQDQADLFVANLVRDARAFVRSASATSLDGTRLSRNTRGGDTIDGKAVPEPDPSQQSPWTKAKAKVKQLTDPKVIDRLIYETQDKLIDLKRLREHIKTIGGTITDLNDAYLGEELYHKRLAKRTEDFLKEELQPLLADMRARGVGTDEFERYLHARHAPEANKALAERNPNQATLDDLRDTARREAQALDAKLVHARRNGSATKAIEEALELARAESSRLSMAQAYRGAEAERKSLSGMSDADAQELIGALTADRKADLDALAARVDVINAQTLELLERYGLMSKASIDAWRRAYQFYVPLHRDEAHVDSRSHPIGSGFSVKGDAARQRVGSNEKVTHILGHIAMQRETALTRGEKNNVVKQLYLMAAQNPDREFWSMDKLPTTKTVDPATGYVRTGVDPAFKTRPNVVMVRVAGRDVAITFNEHNPQALRLAEAMKNLDVGDLHVVLGLAAKGTRWFAAVNTQYNPIFGLINFARDFQEGMLNLSTTPIAGKQRDVASNVFKAMRAIYRTERGKSAADAEWTRLWKEMQDVGGTTGYRDLFADAGERVKALQKELTALDRGQVSKAAHALVDWLSDYNETMENAVRLAAYKVALDHGLTKVRAASLAKNLTVNFNRKGRQTREIGALYAFFNASMQGTARMFETLRGPVGKRIMYGGVALGAINTLLGMAVMGGGGDDDRDDAWERIPEFIKERNLIIPVSGEDYVAIPMPLGFKVFPNIGRLAVEFAFGGPEKSAARQLGKLLMTLADAFNPLGGAQDIGQMAAPTVIDPIAALMTNKDWNGRPIYRENVNGLDPQPGHAMAKDSSSTPARGLARAINAITGGTEYRPGAWSPTPDQIDYVVGQLTGGLGRELLKANQTVASTFTGDELPPYKIPLVGRLYGNTRGSAGHSGAFYENVKTLNELENELKGRQRNDQDVDALFRQEPLMGLILLGNNAENVVRRLRGERRQIVERGDPDSKDRIREVDAEITETMSDLNREVSRARREPAPAN